MTAVYVLQALLTAFRTVRFDGKAVGQYDHSFEGFFRSFFAAILGAPLYFFILAGEQTVLADSDPDAGGPDAMPIPPAGLGTYLIDILLYALDWLAFPLAMIGVAKLIGAGHRYVPYIVAYNWGTCIVLLATLPPYLLYLMGVTTITGFIILYEIAMLFVLVYRWRLARDGLQVPPVTAGGIVVLDLLLSAVIVLLTVRLQRLFQ
jgi:hypothetical protein